ncbi:hypothetical protein B0A58_02295 [Flavobacterium branchiophilum NBRC 15030 = ATCC 35035]|uniref:SusD-like starch-binding protein associating with outer membrane n=1 Tax=Flavobacterium branchiophilum TaxID=55197 RepID=A0A543G5Y8_9FLAO|nr:SusD/RagB family nutrient-binding outer membrane lipoprotein [Flavobacterium branchiophilum]OXA80653.1 hypothetical protein B0A58_02295 [Flavobacterium branchiophilum NBRC 15030 = ATCC 35035]TQM41475.1 SusD-like starch-binding protein associating with outer membrane [Flavobacterium branchiophilum]GEM54176.1 hypothetical protein FB1_03970 [Flavobacterium branchiophilum NBRC 15030 = ATCC 35035]
MKKIFLSLIAVTTLFSCENYLDQPNKDFSNNPLIDKINPAQRLAAAQLNLLNTEVISMNSYGNKMSYTYGLNSGFTSSDVAYNFNYTSGSYDFLWEDTYLYTDNMQDIIDVENAYPNFSNHVAIAKIMKVQGMEKIINLYGDAPYSQAFNTAISQPAYDDDKVIFKNLLLLLDNARTQINNATADAIVPQGEDIVFNGDMNKWIKYANTIELRMLLKLSNTTDATLIALRNSRFAALELNFIDSDVTFNPGFTGATSAQSNPLFRVYGTNVAQTAWTSSNRANAAGDFIAKVLNGTLSSTDLVTTGVVDPRRPRMFSLVGGVVSGAIQGTETSVAKSRLHNFVHGYWGAATSDWYANGTGRNAYAMLAAESYFLQAEAVQRGYIAGNAQTLFNQGITASFNFYSTGFGDFTLSALNAASYIATTNSKQGLGWSGSTDKINAIMTQKWLALSQWTGIEPYFDHLRTGYPKFPVPQGVSQTKRPNRLIYPTSEYSSNSTNVPTVLQSDLFTVNSKTPFYLQ